MRNFAISIALTLVWFGSLTGVAKSEQAMEVEGVELILQRVPLMDGTGFLVLSARVVDNPRQIELHRNEARIDAKVERLVEYTFQLQKRENDPAKRVYRYQSFHPKDTLFPTARVLAAAVMDDRVAIVYKSYSTTQVLVVVGDKTVLPAKGDPLANVLARDSEVTGFIDEAEVEWLSPTQVRFQLHGRGRDTITTVLDISDENGPS